MLAVNNNPNQTNFTANFKLKNITKNLEKWKEAAYIAGDKTTKIPYDVFIEEFQDGTQVYALSKDGFEHSLTLSEDTMKKLFKLNRWQFATKLAKLVRIFAKEDTENTKIIKFLHRLEKSKSAPKELFIDNYAKFAEINENDTRRALNKDSVFRHSEYIS